MKPSIDLLWDACRLAQYGYWKNAYRLWLSWWEEYTRYGWNLTLEEDEEWRAAVRVLEGILNDAE